MSTRRCRAALTAVMAMGLLVALVPGRGVSEPREYSGYVIDKHFPPALVPGVSWPVWIKVINTGTASWPVNGNVKIGTSSPRNMISPYCAADWESCTRPSRIDMNDRAPLKDRVDPGEVARFDFTFAMPDDATLLGPYDARFELVLDLDSTTIWICCVTGHSFRIESGE